MCRKGGRCAAAAAAAAAMYAGPYASDPRGRKEKGERGGGGSPVPLLAEAVGFAGSAMLYRQHRMGTPVPSREVAARLRPVNQYPASRVRGQVPGAVGGSGVRAGAVRNYAGFGDP